MAEPLCGAAGRAGGDSWVHACHSPQHAHPLNIGLLAPSRPAALGQGQRGQARAGLRSSLLAWPGPAACLLICEYY